MPTTTFTALAEVSFGMLNVFLPGEAMGTADANRARTICNRMLSGWGQRNTYIPIISRERFDLVANQGGPTNPYTIGDGGDFDTERPSNQNSITAANLILTATSPEVRVPLGIYTDQSYDANKLPDMSNTQPTGLYYNPTYANDLGSIFLWPVPTTSTNDLELFLQKSIAQFADLTTTYYLPDGGEDVITYQLALRLQGPYGKQMDPEDKRIANEVLGVFKRSNAKMSDLNNDAYVFSQGRRTLYNIQSGSGG
jgi:hypothetical protein